MPLVIEFYNLFLVAFFADAFVSIIDIFCQNALSIEIFRSLRSVIAFAVVLQSLFIYLGIGLFASLPRRILLLPAVFPVGAILIGAIFGPDNGMLSWGNVGSLIQLLIGIYVFARLKKCNAGESIFLRLGLLKEKNFSWKYSLAFFALSMIIIPASVVSSIVVSVANHIETSSKGFVSFGPSGIYSAEKFYEKDGVELRLLGMAHISQNGFYEDIKNSLQDKPALMLMEGVTDDSELLETPPDYGNLAENLGLDSQRDKFSPASMPESVEIIRADLDVSDFASATVDILNLTGKMYSKDGFSFDTFLAMQIKFTTVGVAQSFVADLISKRNECLINHLKENLEKHNLIVIPWGALHLPEVEIWALENGFVLKEQKNRQLFSVVAALKKLFG